MQKFKQSGWVLVDATYEPVNKCTDACRRRIIERDYEELRNDLGSLTHGRPTPVVLIKVNVCRILEPKLKGKFNVLNRGIEVPFPGVGHQKEFREKFGEILKRAGIRQDSFPLQVV